jgi:hypothetical protein
MVAQNEVGETAIKSASAGHGRGALEAGLKLGRLRQGNRVQAGHPHISNDRNEAGFIRRRAIFFERANLPAAYDLAASRP